MAEISKTADKALAVLSELTLAGPRTAQELARATGIDRTVVYRLLRTFEQEQFVHRRDGKYAVSHRLRWLSTGVKPEIRLASDRVVQSIAEDTGETTILAVIDGDEAVVLFQVVPGREPGARIRQQIGDRLPLATGAAGLALLAHATTPTVTRVARRPDTPEDLPEVLEHVRRERHALTVDDERFGSAGVAVPVLDRPGHACAALLVLVPAGQADRLPALVPSLRTAAAEITQNLARG